MKKSNSIIIVIVILVVLIGGGYALFHKSPKSVTATTASGSTGQKSSTPAVNNAVLITKTGSSVGQYLADPSGNALYTYGGDSSGVSNCTGSCLANWPAYQDKGSTTNLPAGVSTITRTDNGQVQFTYNGMPLYTFVNDTAGHVTGNGADNFKVAVPSASSQSSSAPSSSTQSQPSSSSSSNGAY